ncbi:hypothetical protein L1887_39318 [Cichorium endivia]|nr:hypothetical protein L1887_39318 [Cichorium endivia]
MDSTAHQKLSDLLSPYHTKTHLQQNLFFDTPSLTLATAHRAALRLRFYDLDSQAFRFGVNLMEVVSLGGFRNVRAVHKWNGLKLELDETQFDFGVNYEIECESDDPDEAKLMLEELLNQNGIRFSYSQVLKFAIFRSGKLPEFK